MMIDELHQQHNEAVRECERLRALLAQAEAERDRWMARAENGDWDACWAYEWANAAMIRCEDLEADNAELRQLLADIVASGVEHDDERIGYVVVQIDREVWGRVRAAGSTGVDQ